MSGWGVIAAGLAGGAGAVEQTSRGMIDQERRLQSAQALSDIDEQKQLRIQEHLNQMGRANALDDATGIVGKARLEAAGNAARQGQTIALEGDRAKAGDQALNEALRAKARGDAESAHATAKEQTIADANDLLFTGAVTKLALADPRTAAAIAVSRAAAAESGARVGLIGAQTKGAKLANADKEKLDALYDQASAILSDPKIDDATRANKFNDVQRQIVLMKSKSGQVAGRDPELDTQTIVTKKIDPATGVETTMTRKEVRKPGQGGTVTEDADPIKAAMDAARAERAKQDKASDKGDPAKPVGAPSEPKSSLPAIGVIDQGIINDLEPLAQAYKQAKAQWLAVARSGDQQAMGQYSSAMQSAADKLRQAAEGRLGNGAPRYLNGIL